MGILAQVGGRTPAEESVSRLTETAVVDSLQNVHLIKNAATLSLAGSRAGLASFEPGLCVARVDVGGSAWLLSHTVTSTVAAMQGAKLHPKTIACLSS